MSSIFLSHSHDDKPFVRRLGSDLRSAGVLVWVDEAEILVGDSLIDKISHGITRMEYVGAIISSASIESSWVSRELEIAINEEIAQRRVRVIPLLLDDVPVPPFLQGKLYADFRTEDRYESGLTSLLQRLNPSDEARRAAREGLGISNEEAAELERLRRQVALSEHERELLLKRIEIDREAISPGLREAIESDAGYEALDDVNRAFAFELGGMPVTAGYVLHAIRKEGIKGGPHQLAMLAELEGKGDELRLLAEAALAAVSSNSD